MKGLDAYILGLNDPNAPFNQLDYPHPMCEDCMVEECDPWEHMCDKLERIMRDSYIAERRGDLVMYIGWLTDLEFPEAMAMDWDIRVHWLIVNALDRIGIHPPMYYNYIPIRC